LKVAEAGEGLDARHVDASVFQNRICDMNCHDPSEYDIHGPDGAITRQAERLQNGALELHRGFGNTGSAHTDGRSLCHSSHEELVHLRRKLLGKKVYRLTQLIRRHVPYELAGCEAVYDGVLLSPGRPLVRREHDCWRVKRDVLKLAKGGEVVDARN